MKNTVRIHDKAGKIASAEQVQTNDAQTGSAPLVIGRDRGPGYVVFAVAGRTRNGWLLCKLHSEQNGKRLSGDSVFKFRVSDVVPFAATQEVAS